MNGRNFVQLATLTPGTVQETNPNSFFNGGPSSEVSARGSYSLSVGGSRAQSTDWLLDGNDNNELTGGGISILPSIDAIQEFKVLTYNYSAEYGTRAGPTVLLTTKSGSNQIHGSVFEFFRNTSLDARSYFASTEEKFNLNQFGFALGGPIRKDKTFFFVDYQGRRQEGSLFGGFVPTAAMRTGDFSSDFMRRNPGAVTTLTPQPPPPGSVPVRRRGQSAPSNPDGTQVSGAACNKFPASLIDPYAARMAQVLSQPNIPGNAGSATSVPVPVRKLDEGEFDIRLDHTFSSKDSIFARFSYDQATELRSRRIAQICRTERVLQHVRTFTTTDAMQRCRRLTSFPVDSINQISAATTGFSTTFCRLVTVPAKLRSWAFRAQISTAVAPVFRAALLQA